MFTIKFIKLPKKFKEFSETNKVYCLSEVSRFYFEATAMYPELANKQIKLEIDDTLENQLYTIDANIHLDLSLADLIVEQINKTVAKTDDNEQLTTLKKRIIAAFKAEILPFDRKDFFNGAPPKIEELLQEESFQNEQVAEAVDFGINLDDISPITTDVTVLALDEADLNDEKINENKMEITLPTTEEFLNISDFKAMKKLGALKEDVKFKMNEANPIVLTDLELLLFEIDECMKDVSEKVYQKLTDEINEKIENAHAEIDDYKQTVEVELSTKLHLKTKTLESEIKQSFETEKQELEAKHKRELKSLEDEQAKRQDELLVTKQKNLDVQHKEELFELCKDEIKRVENTTLNYIENAKFEFDLTLMKEASFQIDSLLDKRTKIMNQISQFSTPALKVSEAKEMVNAELGQLSSEMSLPSMVSNYNDERITNVVSSMLETKLNEMQTINMKSSNEYHQQIADLAAKTVDLESKLESNTNQQAKSSIPYTSIGFKLLIGVSVAATLFIGLFAYIQVQNARDLNGQLISRNQGLESQLLEMSVNGLEAIDPTILTFNEYLLNGDYLAAAMHHPEEVPTLVRYLFDREDVGSLRTILEDVSETYGWLNVAILEEDHQSIIREFENLLPSEQAQLTIRQQNAVYIAYAEADLTDIHSNSKNQASSDEIDQADNDAAIMSNK